MTYEYTDAMVAKLREAGPLDNESAQAFADEFGFSVHSVRAKAVRDEAIGYQAKPKTRKDGTPVETKAEIVASIAGTIGVDAERMESLANATRDVLVLVREALA
jgi:hypothetical protein